MEHMQRLFDYLSDTGAMPLLGTIEAPPAEFLSLSVIPSYESFVGFAFGNQDRLANDKQRIEIALSTLNDSLSHIEIPNSTSQSYISVGNPRDRILETAKKIQADLIVIGSRNPGMKTYLLGSTASSVVSYAESSVLVVR
ncbi:universal stress protein [Proteus mirabilis]|uniref:universal stress protein n=1 Tax=Proteus mirabilis TaxID=584 RepID=UPI001E461416|nr:universal stress protein [Proteus mirabilis]MCD4641984.1 universal stress protein [Proteus mirabilis]